MKQNFLSFIINFWADKRVRRLLYIVVLAGIALAGVFGTDQTRRTFVFYNAKEAKPAVEEHMLLTDDSEEAALIRYAEETLFGPRNPDSAPLFPPGTKLLSLLYRRGVVYIDLSENAALPVITAYKPETSESGAFGDISRGFSTFEENIRRNFPAVTRIKFFIEGNSYDL